MAGKLHRRFKLAHASPAQQKAAWGVIYPWLLQLANQLQWPVHDIALQKLQDPNVQRQAIAKLDEALDAALNAGG